jgi:outer membrane protein assembly factor BamB
VRAVTAAAALFVVIGASGRAAPPRQSFGVILDARTGRALATIRVNQPIRTAIADGHGGWFIGGGFIRTNGALRKRLAHIGSEGRLDPLWKPEANGNGVSVTSLARIGSRLYVGGDFARLQHKPRLWVGAADTHSGRLLPWQPPPGGINYPVLLAGPDRVYLGGYGVQNASGLAALRPDDGRPAQGWRGIVDTSNIEGGGVRAIARLGGRLYIAGFFGKVDGGPKPGLAALDARTGSLIGDWRPRRRARHCSGCSDVTSLAAARGLVFAGVPGAVVALDPPTGATRWQARVGGFEVNGLALVGKRLYVVGDFGLRALDAETGRRLPSWSPPSTQYGVTAALSGGRVLIGLQPN